MDGVPALACSGPGHRLRWLAVGLAAVALAGLIPRASPSPGRVTPESWSAAAGWAALAPPPSRTPRPVWSRDADTRPGRIVVRPDGIYTLSGRHGQATVTGFDIRVGRARWVTRLSATAGAGLRLGDSGRLLSVTDQATGQAVALLDRVNGRVMWQPGTEPARVGHHFVAGADTPDAVAVLATDSGLVGVNPRTGARRWELSGARDPLVAESGLFARLDHGGHATLVRLDLTTGRPVWTVPTGGATPRIANRVLVLAGPYGLAAFDVADGAPLWSRPNRSGTDVDPAPGQTAVTVTPVSRSALAVGYPDGSVWVIDAHTGAPRYTRPEPRWVSAPRPLRTGQRNLVLGRRGQRLLLLDGADGRPVTSTDRVTEVLAVCAGAVLVRRDGQVSALHPGNLATLWSLPDLPVDARLMTVGGAVVVLTDARIGVYR